MRRGVGRFLGLGLPSDAVGSGHRRYAQVDPEARDAGVLIGIVQGGDKRDQAWGSTKLDSVASDPFLSQFLVYFHGGRDLDSADLARFTAALDAGGVTPQRLGSLMTGGQTKPIPASDLAHLLKRMAERADGILPALETLQMRVFGDRQDKKEIAPELIDFARVLMVDHRIYAANSNRSDHELGSLAPLILAGPKGEATATAICRALRQASALVDYRSERSFADLAKELMSRFPRVVLDEIMLYQEDRNSRNLAATFFGGEVANDVDGNSSAREIDSDVILAWVSEYPGARAQTLAGLVPYSEAIGEDKRLSWTRLARGLIGAAPDPLPVLRQFEERFFTGVSSGPFSARFVRRKPMVEELRDHHDRRVRGWADAAIQRLDEDIVRWDARDREERSLFE